MRERDGMRLLCSTCGGDVDAEVGVCQSCGAKLGIAPAAAAAADAAADDEDDLDFDIDIDCEVSQADIDNVWAANGTTVDEPASASQEAQATAVRDVGRALVLTGVSDAQGVMGQVVPTQIPEFDPTRTDLTPFEGYLLSLVDGVTPIEDIMALSGLTLFETVMALTSLHDKGAVEMKPIGQPAPAISVHPTPAEKSRSALGRLELKQKRVQRGRLEAGDLDPDELVNRADAAFKLGQLESAREYARLALVQAPNSERAKVLMTVLHEPEHAEGRSKIMLGHGMRAFKGKDYSGAIQLLRAALDEYEPQASAHHQLAIALVRSDGDLAEAERHCRRAIELSPGSGVYERNLQRIVHRRRSGGHRDADLQ